MVQFDNQYKQVKLKVVYYGPALGGKTTCLQYIHRVTDPSRRTKLYALNTATDRTLFFDLLSLDLGRVRGYRLTMQLYTVPGQVQYNATRRAVLAGVDGVVFVADSQRSSARANTESMKNLSENLRANGIDPDGVPLVLQYNKRDLPELLPRAELEHALNRRGTKSVETVATTGVGIMDSFSAITEATVVSVADRLGLSAQSDALNRLIGNVHVALQPFLAKSGAPVEAPVVLRPAAGAGVLDEEELLGEAVRANVTMTDLNARLDRLASDLDHRVGQLHAINEFGRLMSLAREPEEVTAGILDRLLADLSVAAGSLLLIDDHGELVEVLRRGLAKDPLLEPDQDGSPAASVIVASRQPFLARLDELEPAQMMATRWAEELSGLGLVAVLAVPLVAQDRSVGLVTCYADAGRGAFEDDDLQLATALAGNAAVALANARAWRALEQLNRSLEQAVAARTGELEETLRKLKALASQVEERNLELEAANRQLREIERLKGDLLSRIAHELNTPVTSIQTATRILERYEGVPPEKAAKFVGIIGHEAERLAEIIASALQAVVLGVGEGKPESKAVPLQELLKRSLAPLKAEVAHRRLAVQVKVAAGLETLRGSEEQLEAALRAVLRNAVEFNQEGGSITVVVRPVRRGSATFVELRVEDSGAGIPAEDLPHVTEVFWQGGNVLTEKPRGLGVGLAVARRVTENHGGRLEIASEPGKGTAVTMLLPVAGPA